MTNPTLPLMEKSALEKVAKNVAAMLPFEWTTCEERQEVEAKIFFALVNAWKRGWKRSAEEIGL